MRHPIALALASLLASVLTAAHAADPTSATVRPTSASELKAIAGREKKPHKDTLLVTPALPKAAEQRMLEKMHRIRDAVLATPALHNLRGYDWSTFDTLKNDHRAAFPVIGRVSYIAFPYAQIHGKVQSSEEGAPFVVHLNEPEAVLGSNGYTHDRDERLTIAPRITGELNGFPVYDGDFVVLTKDKRPLFVPVSEGEYLELQIRKAREEIKRMQARFASAPVDANANRREIDGRLEAIRVARAENEQRWSVMQPKWPDRVAAERVRFDEKERKALAEVEELRSSTPEQRFMKPFQERLTAMEAELAGLSEAQKSGPARFPDGKTTRASGLASADSSSTRIISRLNPHVFDPAKPKHAIQLIILGTTRYLPEVFGPLQKQLDSSELAALLE